MSRILKYIRDPWKMVMPLSRRGVFNFLSDKAYLKLVFRAKFGRKLDLKNPQTYNEKLQWIKLYDRKDIYTTMVDKHAVKDYVAKIIGEEYIIPTLGIWNSFDEIDFEALPDQFVLKCTHDSGGLIICKDKSTLDKAVAKSKIEKCMTTDYYKHGREWPYKNVPHRIIAEQYMVDESGTELKDYKFFCFNGEVKAMFISTGRGTKNHHDDFFDSDFNHLPVRKGHPYSEGPFEKPANFEKMKALAATLSQGMAHARVDFYDVCGKIYFGEITLFSGSGLVPFHPEEWDYTFGSWITLP